MLKILTLDMVRFLSVSIDFVKRHGGMDRRMDRQIGHMLAVRVVMFMQRYNGGNNAKISLIDFLFWFPQL